MSDQQRQQQPPPKKPEPPADQHQRVKVRWAKGGELTDGRYDADRGVIHTTRSRRPVTVSVHSGVVEWWAPA